MSKEEVFTPMCDVKDETPPETGCGCDCNVTYGICDCNTCNAEMGCNDKCSDEKVCYDVKSNPYNNNHKFEQCLALSNHYLSLYNAVKGSHNIEECKLGKNCLEDSIAWADVAGESLFDLNMINW